MELPRFGGMVVEKLGCNVCLAQPPSLVLLSGSLWLPGVQWQCWTEGKDNSIIVVQFPFSSFAHALKLPIVPGCSWGITRLSAHLQQVFHLLP